MHVDARPRHEACLYCGEQAGAHAQPDIVNVRTDVMHYCCATRIRYTDVARRNGHHCSAESVPHGAVTRVTKVGYKEMVHTEPRVKRALDVHSQRFLLVWIIFDTNATRRVRDALTHTGDIATQMDPIIGDARVRHDINGRFPTATRLKDEGFKRWEKRAR